MIFGKDRIRFKILEKNKIKCKVSLGYYFLYYFIDILTYIRMDQFLAILASRYIAKSFLR